MFPNAVSRDGFTSDSGRFYALPGRVEVVESGLLKNMFLPRMTPEANKAVLDNDHFVAGQLKHYGVKYSEDELKGNGTMLLKKMLKSGRCDEVPSHITHLRKRMHREWLNRLTPTMLNGFPEWIMTKYFLDDWGRPDRTKKKAQRVIGIPMGIMSTYRANEIVRAAQEIPDLCSSVGDGCETLTVYLGWDRAAVEEQARGHATKEAKAEADREAKEEKRRASLHERYLANLKRSQDKNPKVLGSLVGSYLVESTEFQTQWPDKTRKMTLNIRKSDQDAVWEASFDFGILEGVMILSDQKGAIANYRARFEDVSDSSNSGEENDSETETPPKAASNKRKAACDNEQSQHGHTHNKRVKGAISDGKRQPQQPQVFHLKWRGRETGEGEIVCDADPGQITFHGDNFASFSAFADMQFVGEAVEFTGRKISDTPKGRRNNYSTYSQFAHEFERRNRLF